MNDRALDRECRAFSAYLIKQRPTDYAMAKYREAHDVSRIVERNEERFLDRLLVNVAVAHPIGAKLVDAYTAIFYKNLPCAGSGFCCWRFWKAARRPINTSMAQTLAARRGWRRGCCGRVGLHPGVRSFGCFAYARAPDQRS